MSSLAHYFVGGVLLSSSTTWLQYFIGHKLSVTNTAISIVSGDIPYWRLSMVLGMLSGVWALSLISPSSVEGIGGWTLQAPKFAIMAGLISGVGSKLCVGSGYDDLLSAYSCWSKDAGNYYGAALVGAMLTSYVVQRDGQLKVPEGKYQIFPSTFGSINLVAIIGIQVIVFRYLQSLKGRRSMSSTAKQAVTGYLCGVYYVMGLCYSGQLCPSKARNFVNVKNIARLDIPWIASILGAWASRYIFSTMTNTASVRRPLFNSSQGIAAAVRQPLRRSVLIGSAVTGIGWALDGLSFGPAMIISTCRPSLSILSYCVCFVTAYYATARVQQRRKA